MEALSNPEEDNGWTVLATTVCSKECTDADILQVYQDQNATVEPGFRWLKKPAVISPVWLEKLERITALAMLTVLGLLVYAIIQRQVRLSLRTHDQQLPGNKGETTTPTMTAEITDHAWTMRELLSFHVLPPCWAPPKQPSPPSCPLQRLIARGCSL
jgi:transposase